MLPFRNGTSLNKHSNTPFNSFLIDPCEAFTGTLACLCFMEFPPFPLKIILRLIHKLYNLEQAGLQPVCPSYLASFLFFSLFLPGEETEMVEIPGMKKVGTCSSPRSFFS